MNGAPKVKAAAQGPSGLRGSGTFPRPQTVPPVRERRGEQPASSGAVVGKGRRLIGSSGRSASAGRIIGVGLLCFAVWLLLDANQLYREAQNGDSDGTRRNVAMDILHPIAAVANALHISGLVNWGDTVLNRNGGAGGNQSLPLPVITTPTVPTRSLQTTFPNGDHYLPHGAHGHGLPLPPPPPVGPPPIVQPTPGHPLTVLDIGDSIGDDLGFGLGDLFSGDHSVHLVQDAVVDTGLVQEGYYNWPGHLQQELDRSRPGAVIIMMGANDDQNIAVNGQVYTPLSKGWVTAYTARVDLLMEESLAAGAHVVWVGLPPMGGGNITNTFARGVNAIFAAQAKAHAGVTYFSSWNVLGGPKGQFELYLKINGQEVPVRATDGVHLDPAGWDLLADSLTKPMQQAWGVNLHVQG